ncbi:hypothetical protein [Romboutsia sp.]|uniref:hypothetical protein n=1 Tax=Romboutsia sp. TaxID=1965302 RepID=UPI003F3FBAED
MIGIEKDILILISRVRCMTETQVGKMFGSKKRYGRKPFKKTLRKMCNEYTLRKYPCNINYSGFRDNSYVYYLNGSNMYKGKDLIKVVIGSELAVKIELGGYELKRFYRNAKVGNEIYDLFIEYRDNYNEIKQILVDIKVEDEMNVAKYEDMENKIKKSTIPIFEIPKVIIITPENNENFLSKRVDLDIVFVDLNLNKLFRYI